MAFKNAAGSNLSETALRALLTEVTTEKIYTVGQNIFQTFTQDGAAFEKGSKLFFYAGQRVKESDVDALFATATIDTVTPSTGTTSGGTAIVISGTNFSGASGVTVGGVAATSFVVVGNERITCVTPAGTAGAKSVVVQDDAGDVTKASGFTYA